MQGMKSVTLFPIIKFTYVLAPSSVVLQQTRGFNSRRYGRGAKRTNPL